MLRAAKVSLRQTMRRTLDCLGPAERATASAEICRRIRALPEWERSRNIALFAPQPTEPDLRSLAPAPGKAFCYPRVHGDELQFFHADFPAMFVASPPWGVMEPDPERCAPVQMAEIDLLLAPGLAFDATGGRLGKGGGFYDRLLEDLETRAFGVCFHVQLLPEIPREPHDRHMHAVITECGVFPEP